MTTSSHTQFIQELINKYYPVKEDILARLQKIAQVQHLKKGEFLLQIGQTSKSIHMLYQGIVVAYFLDANGDAYHKNIFLEGDFVGSTVSALKDEPSHFALEVIEDTTVISFNHQQYRQLIDHHEDLKNFYIAYLEKNWVIDKEKREIAIVMQDAKSRYLDFIRAHPNIEKRVPLRYIASHLGITPTQLSRIRKNLK
ncbi:MAG TPA: Crp/Fnr family transcriptional regulator [Microscillaceae bacterium]|nr:Crp/Fnr family transcriptional regulator [Microscillaceae bacterium]